MNTGQRINYLRKELLHLTLEELGAVLGLGKSALSKLERGENNPTPQFIKSICREYHVNEEWLLSGNGEPFVNRSDNEIISDYLNGIMELSDEAFKKRFSLALSQLPEEGWKMLEEFCDKVNGTKE